MMALLVALLVACNRAAPVADDKAPAPIPPAPNANVGNDVALPAPVPPVSDGSGFTLVYTHSMDGEIEPCG